MIALIGAGDFLVLPSSRPQDPEESANAMTSIGSSPWQAQPRVKRDGSRGGKGGFPWPGDHQSASSATNAIIGNDGRQKRRQLHVRDCPRNEWPIDQQSPGSLFFQI